MAIEKHYLPQSYSQDLYIKITVGWNRVFEMFLGPLCLLT